jgi:hypothetical protein
VGWKLQWHENAAADIGFMVVTMVAGHKQQTTKRPNGMGS